MTPITKLAELPQGMGQALADLILPDHWNLITGRQEIFLPHRETRAIFIRSVPDPAAKNNYDMNFGAGRMVDHPMRAEYQKAFDPIMTELGKLIAVEEWAATVILLPAKGQVRPHRDVYPNPPNLHRIHLPLKTNPLCHFYCGKTRLHMRADTFYEVSNLDYVHWVENKGSEDRLHLVIDVQGLWHEN